MGNILIFALIALAGVGMMFYPFMTSKLTEHQRLLLRLRDPELHLDTLIAELRYAKMLTTSQEERLEIFEEALKILAAHPQDPRCKNFALDFGQWYCAVSCSHNKQLTQKEKQHLQLQIWARYQELVVSQ